MKFVCLFLVGIMVFAADPPKTTTEKPAVHLTDAEKAQLYKTLAEAANAQAAAMQAQQQARVKADELTRLRERLEQKCGTGLSEEAGGLADCAAPKKEIAAK